MSVDCESVAERRPQAHEVELVVVPRERYSTTVDCLRQVLETIPDDIRVTLVRGGMPDRMVAEAVMLGGGRIKPVGPLRHLAPNAARSIGLGVATAQYVVFIDNDVVPSPGWLSALFDLAVDRDAWVVRPLVLQRIGAEVRVHESGGDCHLERCGETVRLVETHRHLGWDPAAVKTLCAEEVELFEFHLAMFHRERLLSVGGPDERMRSIGDHLDLALSVRDAGGSIWLEPAAKVTYLIPNRLPLGDVVYFLGRWSPSWTAASRAAFDAKHGVNDSDDPYETWNFAEQHRAYAWLPIGRVVASVLRRPVALGVAKRFDRGVGRHVATAVQRLAPRWRGDGSAVAP